MDQALQSYLARIAPTVTAKSAQAVIELAAEGATVPFIARYRKEKTGNLDEVQIRAVIEGHETYNEIVKRKAFLIKEIGEQNNLTAEIQKRIELSWDLGELEEIYKPFKKKKKTKATIAREAGLEPLANWIWEMGHGLIKDDQTMEMKAKNFLNPTAKIATYEEALKGAQDILVEKVANDADLRAMVAKNYNDSGRVVAKAAKGYKANSKYEMYKEFEEPVKNLLDAKNNHRYLAMRRGWQEEELSVDVKGDDEAILKSYENFATSTPDNAIGDYLKQCARLALNVYVLPSVVNEVHRQLKEKADQDAITVFAENVRKLLLASPYGPKCVLGVDPGLRTGCKVALIDKSGAFISHTVLYTLGDDADRKAKVLFGDVMKQIQIEAIAVGNGTAGRETESFLKKVLKDLGKNIPVVMVSESGASVYSASEVAREEFPDLDVTVKGAISIARRLQDPLAELVKVDPKSIGVGQYQHDVNQSQLKKSLEAVVESCVNNVGVDVNTASAALLSHVAGIGPALAKGIVEARKKTLFNDRTELLKVPKFSAKVFEQAAGFLRIPQSKQVLDSTGIHPERYQAVTDMAKDLGVSLSDVIGEGAKKLVSQRTKWAQLVGEFTFDDIVKELEKPGRDPRDPFKVFQYRDDIMEVKDLKEGMICPGIVTNVTNFGAFVDIGVHQDGLVHISALSHKFVDDPRKVVNPGDHVTVKVLKVDVVKNQISLTMKMDDAPEATAPRGERRPENRGASRPMGQGQRPPAGKPAQAPMKPANPFNNPFAALMNVPTNKK
ncbi:Tex family protein [Bdellovibrio sp.]|uniref:Tex family protein n=1 Tax=Bdellovibrio sp. TaxID=28201 RepID=UPI003221AE98